METIPIEKEFIDTFEDLLHIVETRPKWRQRLTEALFPNTDLPKILREITENQQETTRLIKEIQREFE
ncbi:MAG: hypothetical protein GY861_19310, partial [bacterium]|nr:hypothetical protein [bacterium]